jgi:hypothetical protein
VTTPPSWSVGAPLAGCAPIQAAATYSHNQGLDCLSCHQNQNLNIAAQYRWNIAGTLWMDPYGVSPRAGATVQVVDATGLAVKMVTDSNGNFYSSQAVTMPLSALASACPGPNQKMNQNVVAGSCNGMGCHDATHPMVLP